MSLISIKEPQRNNLFISLLYTDDKKITQDLHLEVNFQIFLITLNVSKKNFKSNIIICVSYFSIKEPPDKEQDTKGSPSINKASLLQLAY